MDAGLAPQLPPGAGDALVVEDAGDFQGVPLDHQVQQFQKAAAVVPGPAGFFGSDISQGAAGADQPLHLQVQILVLRLSHRDPGVTVERHPVRWLGMKNEYCCCRRSGVCLSEARILKDTTAIQALCRRPRAPTATKIANLPS